MADIFAAQNAEVGALADAGPSLLSKQATAQKVDKIGQGHHKSGVTYGPVTRWAHGKFNAAVERAWCRNGKFAAKFRCHAAKVTWHRQ